MRFKIIPRRSAPPAPPDGQHQHAVWLADKGRDKGALLDHCAGYRFPASARTSCRNSRTTAWNLSASSICGECPDFSKTTSRELGISDAIVSADETGVIQSVRPTVTKVGQRTPGSCGFRS